MRCASRSQTGLRVQSAHPWHRQLTATSDCRPHAAYHPPPETPPWPSPPSGPLSSRASTLMRPEDIAYADLCLAVWEMGWRLWWERWAEMVTEGCAGPAGCSRG